MSSSSSPSSCKRRIILVDHLQDCKEPIRLRRKDRNVLVVLSDKAHVDSKNLDFKVSLVLPAKVTCKTYSIATLIDKDLLRKQPVQSTLSLTVSVLAHCGTLNVATLFAYLTRNTPSPSGQPNYANNAVAQLTPVVAKKHGGHGNKRHVQWLLLS